MTNSDTNHLQVSITPRIDKQDRYFIPIILGFNRDAFPQSGSLAFSTGK